MVASSSAESSSAESNRNDNNEWPEFPDDSNDEDFEPESLSTRRASLRSTARSIASNAKKQGIAQPKKPRTRTRNRRQPPTALSKDKHNALDSDENNTENTDANEDDNYSYSSADGDDNLDDDDSDDDDKVASKTSKRPKSAPAAKTKRQPPKRQQRRGTKGQPKQYNEDEEESSFEEEDDDDEEGEENSLDSAKESPNTSRGRGTSASRKHGQSIARGRGKQNSSSATGQGRSSRSTRVPAKRNARATRSTRNDDDDNNNNTVQALDKGRPSRSSATLATQRLKQMKQNGQRTRNNEEHSNSSDSSGSENYYPQKRKSPAKGKRGGQLSSDEEFLADSTSENSEDMAKFIESDSSADEELVEDTDEEEEDADDLNARGDNKRVIKAVSIDQEKIGSADESSDDEVVTARQPIVLQERSSLNHRKPAARNQLDEILPSSRHSPSSHDSDDSVDDNGSDRHSAAKNRPRWPICASVEDAITNEQLPKRHVCFISPDGESRQCFSLETLRQVALKSASMPFRVDLDGSTKDTFLQPPHFRTAMSDDLLDQIASRFGREALDLHGAFYNRGHNLGGGRSIPEDSSWNDEDYDDIFGPGEPLASGDDFLERMNSFMSKQMGSRDIYVCPLCYSETHRRIIKRDRYPNRNDDDLSDKEFLQLPSESEYDPMLVLGWLDNDKFEIASLFCFWRVSQLKQHLREDHHVQTKDIQGNDLYQRYQLRVQDGLLQRYLHNRWRRHKATTFQGAMQVYWFSGNNRSFIYLLHMVERAQYFGNLVNDDTAEEDTRLEAEQYLEAGRAFFDTIQSRAEEDWDQISAPFSKGEVKDDLRDFLADDDDDEIEDELPPFLTHQALKRRDEEDSDQNDLVHKLQRKYAEGGDDDDDDDRESGELESNEQSGDDSSESSDAHHNPPSSEEDEWVNSIRKKRLSKLSSPNKPATPVLGKKLTRRKAPTPSSTVSKSRQGPALKRPKITEESDEE